MFSLSPVDRLFRGYMSGVVSVSLLAFTIDYEAAAAYAPRTRCAWATTLSMLRDNRTTVEDCLKWLTGKEESSIGFGSMFLRYVRVKATKSDVSSYTSIKTRCFY